METTGNPIEGNTRLRSVPSKYWCFTKFYDKKQEVDTLETLESIFRSKKIDYIIGKEICPSSKRHHLQGFISSSKKIRPNELVKDKSIHWEKCKGSKDDNVNYCAKEGNFVGTLKPKRPLEIISDECLYEWERDIISIINNIPDKRSIYWIWEKKGLTGKTTFAKYLAHKYNAIPLEGKKNDILFCAANFESDTYVWDLERSMENYISYAALEKIKNGFFMCSKYESKPIIRNCPHVFVFANFPPDTAQLSEDRWRIYNLEYLQGSKKRIE